MTLLATGCKAFFDRSRQVRWAGDCYPAESHDAGNLEGLNGVGGPCLNANPKEINVDLTPLRVTQSKGLLKAEFGQEGLEVVGSTLFRAAGVVGQDEFVFHAVFPADQFSNCDGIAF